MAEIRPDIGVAAEQVLSQDRVDAFLQGVSEPGSLVRELRRLRAENAALKERMQRLSDALACAINVIEGDDPAWTEKFIRQSRRLLIPESGRVPYAFPQAAEPVEKETPMGGTSKDKVI